MALHVPHLKRALSTEAERQPPKRRVGPTAVIQVHADRIRRFIASNVRLGIPVRGTFDACDYDEDGILSMFDLKEVAQLLGMELAEDELQDLFQELDVDRDGAISPKDFERFFSRSTDVGHKFFNTRKTKRGKAKLKKLLDAERRAAKRIEQRDEQHKRPALPLNAEAKRGRHTFGQTSARHTVHYHAKRKDWRKEEKEEADEDPDSSEDLTVTYRRTKWCLQLISALEKHQRITKHEKGVLKDAVVGQDVRVMAASVVFEEDQDVEDFADTFERLAQILTKGKQSRK